MARYADLPIVTVSTEVAATPAELWPLISDITVPVQFSEELTGVRWLEPSTGPALGAMFEGTNQHPLIGEWRVQCAISVFEPDREFGWDPGGPEAPFAKWRFSLEPTLDPDGATTTLTFSAQMGFGPSGLTMAIEARPDREERLVDHRLEEWRTNMRATIGGIKDLAESRTLLAG